MQKHKHSMVENLEGEVWKKVNDYENYQISNYGRVKSLNYRHTGEERLLMPQTEGNGYLFVHLCKDGQRKMFKVHRLVATAFIENPMPLFHTDINHKDECKTNNSAANLEWCDRKYNANFGTRTERVAAATSKRVGQFTLQGELIKEWPSTAECGRNGFNQRNVSACCRGERHKHKGCIWKYLA